MKPFIVFFTVFGISMAAPQGFGLVGFKFKILSSNEFLCYDGCWFQGDLLNGIVETVSGEKRYDSPPYNVVATYTVGSKSVSLFFKECTMKSR